MLWLWILLVIAALILLVCVTRVGVWAAFGGDGVRLNVRVGVLQVHILPAKVKKRKGGKAEKKKKAKPEKKVEAKTDEGGEKKKLPFTFEDVKDAVRTLFPPLRRALGRTRKGVRIRPLRLSVVLGGLVDPAASAKLYGEIQAAVWNGMPVLEKLVDIPEPYIHTDVDFLAAAPAVEGEVGVTFRIGTLIAVGFGIAFPAVRWFLKFRKRLKKRAAEAEKAEPVKDPAA